MARVDWRRPKPERIPDGVRRIALTLSYDGTAFHGWQSQGNANAVQSTLSAAAERIFGSAVAIQGSGRTDAGVHALGQVCHMDIPKEKDITPDKIVLALNANLPRTVRVLSAEEKEGCFHARFSTMAREYKYFVKKKSEMLPFDFGYVASVSELPSLGTLNSYASLVRGTHDFSAFCGAGDMSESKMRDIYESEWAEVSDAYGRKCYCYRICGNAFLYHQVRMLVGEMLRLGSHNSPASEFGAMLGAGVREKGAFTAPSEGLYLSRISYDEDEYAWFEEEAGNGR